jgi:preprotein translocase subunit SecG
MHDHFLKFCIYIHRDYTNFPANDKSNRALKFRKSTVTIVSSFMIILFVLIIIGLIYILQRRYSHQKNNNTHHRDRLNSECTYSKLLIKNESDPN